MAHRVAFIVQKKMHSKLGGKLHIHQTQDDFQNSIEPKSTTLLRHPRTVTNILKLYMTGRKHGQGTKKNIL